MMERNVFDLGLRSWLEAKTAKQIGLSNVPAQSPELPYAILYSLTTGQFSGSWADPQEDVVLYYQIRSVGESYRQCAAMSDLIRQKMVGRTGGAFTEEMIVNTTNIQNREVHQLGAIMASGDNLYEVSDLYRLTTGA